MNVHTIKVLSDAMPLVNRDRFIPLPGFAGYYIDCLNPSVWSIKSGKLKPLKHQKAFRNHRRRIDLDPGYDISVNGRRHRITVKNLLVHLKAHEEAVKQAQDKPMNNINYQISSCSLPGSMQVTIALPPLKTEVVNVQTLKMRAHCYNTIGKAIDKAIDEYCNANKLQPYQCRIISVDSVDFKINLGTVMTEDQNRERIKQNIIKQLNNMVYE